MSFEENCRVIFSHNKKNKKKQIIDDYFSWGRDKRHVTDDSEDIKFNGKGMPSLKMLPRKIISLFRNFFINIRFLINSKDVLTKSYHEFSSSFNLMSDKASKDLFCELILQKIYGEKKIVLSSFTKDFVDSYEDSSREILESKDTLQVYKWILRKVLDKSSNIKLYTVPTLLNLIKTNRLYQYNGENKIIKVNSGDIVIDAGVGWGDTCTYLANACSGKEGGHLYAFDIVDDAISALKSQLSIQNTNLPITIVKKALYNQDNVKFYTTDPSPAAHIVKTPTNYKVKTIKIDTFAKENNLPRVDFIKMDIEGAEREALAGAREVIEKHKPKLAISVYHLEDDLKVIPNLINSYRNDYEFYLDCTTGFGGETILYCS